MAEKNKAHTHEKPNDTISNKTNASNKHFDDRFNKMYTQWRIDNEEKFGFVFRANKGKFTYQDSIGFIRDIPETKEKRAIQSVNSIIGVALVSTILLLILNTFLLPGIISSRYHVSLYLNKEIGIILGNEEVSFLYRLITETSQRLLAMAILLIATGMPLSVAFPLKISNKTMLLFSLPAVALITSTEILLDVPNKFVIGSLGLSTARSMYIPDNPQLIIPVLLMNALWLPIINELVTRGIMMQLLRQFGDGYALVISALVSAFMANDIRSILFIFIFSICIGYFMLCTGSVLVPILMRISLNLILYADEYLRNFASPTEHKLFLLLMLFFSTVSMFMLILKHSDKISLPFRKMYLTSYEKAMYFLTEPSVILWISISIGIALASAPTIH